MELVKEDLINAVEINLLKNEVYQLNSDIVILRNEKNSLEVCFGLFRRPISSIRPEILITRCCKNLRGFRLLKIRPIVQSS